MSYSKARDYLAARGYENRIKIFDVSSATVELTIAELEALSGYKEWINVCSIPD